MNHRYCLYDLATALPLLLLIAASSTQETSNVSSAKLTEPSLSLAPVISSTVTQPPSGDAATTHLKTRGQSRDRAIEAAASAQQLQSLGDWEGALKELKDARMQCENGEEGRVCQEILDYSHGYVLQQSSAYSSTPEEFLRQAAVAYEDVLKQTPAHGPTLENLMSIYQQLGEPDRAALLLRQAIASDPAATSKLKIQLGDLLLQTDSPMEARKIYSEILGTDPYNAAVGHRLVFSHELAPSTTSAEELTTWGQRWDTMSPKAARHAYEAAIRIAYQSNPSKAEDTLIQWVDLLGRSREISIDDLAYLPEAWQSAALRDLRAFLNNPEIPPLEKSWWQDHGGERSVALAQASLSLGQARLDRGEVALAEATWCVGRDLATHRQEQQEEQESHGEQENQEDNGEQQEEDNGEQQEYYISAPKVIIDIQAELALLYFHYPQLDPTGNKFQQTDTLLFNEKEDAYAHDDLLSIQRYHEALGLIYAQREIWEGPDARGALTQLWSALDSAADWDNKAGTYQPLPWIREKLADGYLATDSKRQALSSYLGACEAYLDVDDLAKAEAMLSRARELSIVLTVEKEGVDGLTDEEEDFLQLSQIFPARRKLTDEIYSQSQKTSITRSNLNELGENPWLDPAWTQHRKGFVDNQRFKTLADLAFVASRDNSTLDLSLSYAARAMTMALDGEATLVGVEDLVRIQRIQTLIAGVFNLELEEPHVVPAETNAGAGHLLYLALPSDRPTFVLVSKEAELATRIINRADTTAILTIHPTLQIHGGAVFVIRAQPGTDIHRLLQLLRTTQGIESVTVDGDIENF